MSSVEKAYVGIIPNRDFHDEVWLTLRKEDNYIIKIANRGQRCFLVVKINFEKAFSLVVRRHFVGLSCRMAEMAT